TELDGEIILDWGYDFEAVAATEETISKGFTFEGYNIYQLPSAGSPLSEGKKVATYDKINLVQTIFDPGVDEASGYIVDQPKQSGTNSGVQRYFRTDNDALRGRPMSNGITYHFAITAYSYLTDNEGSPFKTLESSPTIKSVTPHSTNPGFSWNSEPGGDIETTHSGTAGGSVSVSIVNPSDLTGNDYAVTFDIQHYYMDVDGLWKFTDFADSVGTLGRSDVSPSTVTGIAYTSPTGGTRDLIFIVDVVSPDYNYAAGVKLTFPAGIVINSAEASGSIAAMISTDGSNSVMFGDTDVDGAGDFAGGEVLTVNVDTPALPLDVDYVIYDDGWATLWCVDNAETCEAYLIGPGYTETVNATGTCTVSEEAYAFKSIKHWNLTDTTTSTVLLEDQHVINGTTLENIVGGVYDAGGASLGIGANPIVDGLQVNVNVGYDAPVNYESISDGGVFYGSTTYTIGSYYDYGWAATAKSIDAYGNGLADVSSLQRDVKVVWDGVMGEADANGFVPVASGGSQVWIYGARGYTLDAHTSPENPGTGDPFLITVPFKVYDMEPEGGGDPVQISLIIYDRIADPTVTPFYAFNPSDRMYTEFVLRPYEETLTDFASNEAFLTWNTVWWGAPYEAGNEINFVYANPIQQGVDTWTFASVANDTSATIDQNSIDLISIYPNPYYGLHEKEESRADKYVGLNHLPEKATIKIFNLGGTMVKEIKKDDQTQFATWDLKNQYGYPVASGIYLVHVNTDYGEKVLKLAVVQETQVLKYY
ncbi:MAG: T9SS type A sorting domain-containing protein, partial [Candidatus Marinimicrobia bacterium]|nr:T9SS type A sorting domain-containing protein [Candidatus Neomarinimicrobiota bacterium]